VAPVYVAVLSKTSAEPPLAVRPPLPLTAPANVIGPPLVLKMVLAPFCKVTATEAEQLANVLQFAASTVEAQHRRGAYRGVSSLTDEELEYVIRRGPIKDQEQESPAA